MLMCNVINYSYKFEKFNPFVSFYYFFITRLSLSRRFIYLFFVRDHTFYKRRHKTNNKDYSLAQEKERI